MIDANMIESITEQSVDQLIHGSISPQISFQCVVISPVNYQTKRARENGILLRLIFDLFFEKCNRTKYPSPFCSVCTVKNRNKNVSIDRFRIHQSRISYGKSEKKLGHLIMNTSQRVMHLDQYTV